MSTFFNLTGTVMFMVGVQLTGSAMALEVVNSTSSNEFSTATQRTDSFVSGSETSSEARMGVKDSGGYQPPEDIGGPGRSQGSGTR